MYKNIPVIINIIKTQHEIIVDKLPVIGIDR